MDSMDQHLEKRHEEARVAPQAVDRLSTLQENAPGAGHRLAQLGGVGGGSSVLPCVEGRA
jgi:hypothetical protein